MILFKDMTVGALVYALVKDENELKYIEGSIVSVSQPRMNMPDIKPGQMPMQMPAMQQVVDVTYSLEGKNYTDVVDSAAGVFSTNNPGAVTMVSTEKDAVVRELHATLKTSENYLKDAEREVPKQKKRIKDCKALILQLDTEFKEKQQTEERFAKIEESQRELGTKLDRLLNIVEKKSE